MKEYNQLTTEEKILVNSEVEKRSKNSSTAWILWMFLGTVGGHRYYLNRKNTGIIMTILTFTVLGMIITIPWAVIDAFFIQKWICEDRENIEQSVINNL